MARQTFFTNPNSKPSGFSPATKVGNQVFISGHVAVDGQGNVVGEGDAGAQSEQVFKNLEAALTVAGATWDDVTKITCFMLHREDYPAYAAVRLKYFPENGPASSTVFIPGLVRPEYLIEIEATAVLA